mmetsp:Transcript_25536/g.71555  ORF Transcript_25536/g.71555 Transcript_25536/m.71555 type:complete len:303 (-) Transcript_25536:596-1504(-)
MLGRNALSSSSASYCASSVVGTEARSGTSPTTVEDGSIPVRSTDRSPVSRVFVRVCSGADGGSAWPCLWGLPVAAVFGADAGAAETLTACMEDDGAALLARDRLATARPLAALLAAGLPLPLPPPFGTGAGAFITIPLAIPPMGMAAPTAIPLLPPPPRRCSECFAARAARACSNWRRRASSLALRASSSAARSRCLSSSSRNCFSFSLLMTPCTPTVESRTLSTAVRRAATGFSGRGPEISGSKERRSEGIWYLRKSSSTSRRRRISLVRPWAGIPRVRSMRGLIWIIITPNRVASSCMLR